jgi:plastocyanin
MISANAQTSTTFTIGVDNVSPAGHDYEYVDFFPRGLPLTGEGQVSSTVIPDDSTVDFKWNSGSPDGFHTATLLKAGTAPGPTTWGSDHPLAVPENESAEPGQLRINPAILSPSSPTCGFGPQAACDFSGDAELNSGALPTASGAEFKVHIFLDSSQPTTIHFVCLIHPGMQGALTIVPNNSESAAGFSTQATLDATAAAQYAADTQEANAAENQANSKAVRQNADGTHTITMSAGTASAHVEVTEMLPSRVEIRPGDHVKWVTGTKSDVHTVTFPQGNNPATEPLPFVCESESGPDTAATGPPPSGCSNPTLFENHLNPGPVGGTVIASSSTVASSGVIANPPAPFPTNYTFTFPNSGTFAYQCRIHDHMTGTIVVNPAQAASNPPASTTTVLAQTGSGPLPFSPWPFAVGAALALLGIAGLGLRRRSRA